MGKSSLSVAVVGVVIPFTAPCAFVKPWAAALIGILAAILIYESVGVFERRGIDDPVGAISVHGVGGLFGVLCVGIFADGTYGSGWNGTGNAVASPVGHGVQGIIKGDWGQLGAQAIGCLTLITVMFGKAFAFFFIQNKLTKGGIRSDEFDEMVGLDIPEMGVLAYPEFDLVKDDLTKKSESKVPASV